jgi:hypothetical protein
LLFPLFFDSYSGDLSEHFGICWKKSKARVEKVLAFLNLFSTQICFPSKLGIANSRDPKQSERIGHFLRRELPRKV